MVWYCVLYNIVFCVMNIDCNRHSQVSCLGFAVRRSTANPLTILSGKMKNENQFEIVKMTFFKNNDLVYFVLPKNHFLSQIFMYKRVILYRFIVVHFSA